MFSSIRTANLKSEKAPDQVSAQKLQTTRLKVKYEAHMCL